MINFVAKLINSLHMFNSNRRSGKGINSVFIVVMVIIGVFALAMAKALHILTLCDALPVVLLGCGIGLLFGVLLRGIFARCSRMGVVASTVCCVLWCAVMCVFGLYAVNYFGASDTATHTEKVVVRAKRYATRHRSKRIRRGVYGQGEEYKVYYLDIEFADGTVKQHDVALSRYRRYSKGDSIEVVMSKGALGLGDVYRF